jgi:mono/diheme cytochrome c family protein
MKKTIAVVALACAALMSQAFHGTLQAQAGRTTAAGVYTDAQAKRGAEVYKTTCESCHGADMKGTAVIPSLAGPEFENFWRGQPLGDLFEKISTTMPKSMPGSLTPQQSADVTAYMLSTLKAPAGKADLAPKVDELKQITIQAAQ